MKVKANDLSFISERGLNISADDELDIKIVNHSYIEIFKDGMRIDAFPAERAQLIEINIFELKSFLESENK
jgi:hypothetical protein